MIFRKKSSTSIFIILFAILAASAAGIAFAGIEGAKKLHRDRLMDIARAEARGIDSLLGPYYIAGYLFGFSLETGSGSNFEVEARRLVERWPVLSHIAIAPGGVVRDVYPSYGGASPIGIDLLADPVRGADAAAAKASKSLIVTPPSPLADGKLGLSALYPVFTAAAGQEPKFWGFSVAVLRIGKLVDLSGLPQIEKRGYRWSLSAVDAQKAWTFAEAVSGAPDASDAATAEIVLPGSRWRLAVGPDGPTRFWLFFAAALALGTAGAAAAALFLTSFFVKRRKLEEMANLLAESLKEKETFLREIHHRVKNNLMVVESVVSLQSIDAQGTRFEEAFAQLAKRIHSISLIHDKLYRGKDMDSVDARSYVVDLTEYIADTLGTEGTVQVDADDFSISAKAAMPVGLILTELCTNAHKYGKGAPVRVSLKRKENIVSLVVEDDGPPLPEGYQSASGLGLRLVDALAGQVNGKWVAENGPPVRFTVTFPLEPNAG